MNAAEGLFPSVVSSEVCIRALHAANVGGRQNYPQTCGNVKQQKMDVLTCSINSMSGFLTDNDDDIHT